MSKVYVVRGEHFSVPGIPLNVFSTLAKAQVKALELANLLREHVKLKPATDPLKWEAAAEAARVKHAKNLGYPHVSYLDDEPEDDGWVDIFETDMDPD